MIANNSIGVSAVDWITGKEDDIVNYFIDAVMNNGTKAVLRRIDMAERHFKDIKKVSQKAKRVYELVFNKIKELGL